MYNYYFSDMDINGDGNIDALSCHKDFNGDGFDEYIESIHDYDFDGYFETHIETHTDPRTWEIDHSEAQTDTNGDGMYDQIVVIEDTNHDGINDTETIGIDSNHSGSIDYVVRFQDTTGDGNHDIITKEFDYNQDGKTDSVTTYRDIDGDGNYDIVTKEYDSTGDGEIDKVDVYIDETGTGQPDIHEVYQIDPDTGELIPSNISTSFLAGTMIDELENFEPNESYPDGISGDPESSMYYWEHQGQTNRCALFSQKFIIEEFTGRSIDIEDFAAIAEQNGWFTEEDGTTALNMNKMLDYYDVENEMTFHNSIEDIEECLNNGGRVVVSIDCEEIWYGKDNNIFSPESCSNHAVEVIGIDRTDPQNPMIILNDSGTLRGCGEMVPLDVFKGAWEDGDCQLIKCYPKQ